MSGWISGLADKAENILNKIDQNAATALQLPPSPNTTQLDAIRRNITSTSTQSLTSLTAPAKLSHHVPNAMSVSDSGVDWGDKLDWQVGGMSSSSSVKAKSVTTINVDTELEQKNTSVFGSADNKELIAFKIALNEVTCERNELRQRLSVMNNDLELIQLRQRAEELDTLILRLTEERDQLRQEVHDSQNINTASLHSISELESNLVKLQQEYFEISQKHQLQLHETQQLRQELQEYRSKAQRALQIKDTLIAEMKEGRRGHLTEAGTDHGNDEARLLQLEYDALKQEHQSMLDEKGNMEQQLEQLHDDLSTLHKQHNEQVALLRSTEETLRKELRLQRENTSEQWKQQQDIETLQQQLRNQMAAAATRLQEKDQQLQALRMEQQHRHQVDGRKQEDVAALGEYASRVKVLTQSLIDKQNKVEQLTVERNVLRIQMEKLQDKLQQNTYTSNLNVNNASRNVILLNSTDDAKAQYPLLMKANPFDNHVARRMKRAYTSLDSAGIRLNAFLRRNPLMRILVLVYVALLHIWVIFVLLSTTPN